VRSRISTEACASEAPARIAATSAIEATVKAISTSKSVKPRARVCG
jgi:hypothetical protein